MEIEYFFIFSLHFKFTNNIININIYKKDSIYIDINIKLNYHL